MNGIEFNKSEKEVTGYCLACKNKYIINHTIKLEHSIFGKCSYCSSYSILDESMVNANYQNLSRNVWINYVESNAGIATMLSFVERCLPDNNFSSFIDVGCGFGFVVDYVKKYYGIHSVGLKNPITEKWVLRS